MAQSKNSWEVIEETGKVVDLTAVDCESDLFPGSIILALVGDELLKDSESIMAASRLSQTEFINEISELEGAEKSWRYPDSRLHYVDPDNPLAGLYVEHGENDLDYWFTKQLIDNLDSIEQLVDDFYFQELKTCLMKTAEEGYFEKDEDWEDWMREIESSFYSLFSYSELDLDASEAEEEIVIQLIQNTIVNIPDLLIFTASAQQLFFSDLDIGTFFIVMILVSDESVEAIALRGQN